MISHITFKPQQKNYPEGKTAMTNLGSFLPGDTRSVGFDQQKEAERLVAAGDFVASDADGKKVSVAKAEESEAKASKSKK